jgi:hypothetical protein
MPESMDFNLKITLKRDTASIDRMHKGVCRVILTEALSLTTAKSFFNKKNAS